MKTIILTFISLLLIISYSFGQDCLKTKFMLRGYCYAGTSQVDSLAFGGFYKSKRRPQKITKEIEMISTKNEFQLIAKNELTKEFAKDIEGFKLFVINNTDSTVKLLAQDSRLYLKRQVYYKGKWQDIEYLPNSWCGNSYHSVFIQKKEYWEFVVPCLEGKIEATFRFKLQINNEQAFYSNEFMGSFNKKQLKKRRKYKPKGIMDPYLT